MRASRVFSFSVQQIVAATDKSNVARFARQLTPGNVAHIISRFVNRRFRLEGVEERREYMSRAERAAKDFDWAMLAYGLTSSHTHLASQVGADPLSRFCKRPQFLLVSSRPCANNSAFAWRKRRK